MKRTLGAFAVGTTVLSLALTSVAYADAMRKPAPAAKAATSVVIGQVSAAPSGCGTGVTAVQTSSAGPSYTVPATPARSVITSYSYTANAIAGSVRVLAFVPGVGANNWTVVGKSPLAPVTLSTVNTFPARVPVPAGAQLGFQTSSAGSMACGTGTVMAADVFAYSFVFNPDVGNDMAATASPGIRANISAVVESDADADGFGDVTQDACPESALAQAACPAPETIVTKKPSKVGSNPKMKIKFTSSVAGSTFLCSRDGKPFKTCTSPYTKRVKLGKHKVKIQAVSPASIVDATPAKVKFTVSAS